MKEGFLTWREAPDKIYIQRDIINSGDFGEMEFDDDIEYVRKDMLLKWLEECAENLKRVWMAHPNNTEAFHKQTVCLSVIDKLNSL